MFIYNINPKYLKKYKINKFNYYIDVFEIKIHL